MAPVLGLFEFDLCGRTAYLYSLVGAVRPVPGRAAPRPLALRPVAARHPGQPAARLGDRRAEPDRRLVAIYTLAAAYAGLAGALLAQTTQFVSLDVLDFHRSADVLLVLVIGGAGYLYGGLIGAVVFKLLQDWIAALTPQYWLFWIGLFLVVVRPGRAGPSAPRRRATSPSRIGARLAEGRVRDARRAGRSGPRDLRPRQALRRHRRHQRRLALAGAGRPPCADRAERRRQDDLRQPADRRASAERRPNPARRARTSPADAAACAGEARPGPHLPDQPALRRT